MLTDEQKAARQRRLALTNKEELRNMLSHHAQKLGDAGDALLAVLMEAKRRGPTFDRRKRRINYLIKWAAGMWGPARDVSEWAENWRNEDDPV